jgi:outer membrane protein insertion porin family
LKTLIQSKPGILWLFKGMVDSSKIDEDVERLTAYYRSLGFFRARVGREMKFDSSGKWLSLTYVIDEGPQYRVRKVSVIGNTRFASEDLLGMLKLQSGDEFNLGRMNRDRNALLELYGGQGYIFADIEADPRFLEEPGQLDLVFNIDEGDQYRVGRINVHIGGDMPHTRHNAVLNRISVRPGDIININEVRASERRLKASQLFENNPAQGVVPKIVIRPPDLEGAGSLAGRRDAGTYRGQSPDDRATRRP